MKAVLLIALAFSFSQAQAAENFKKRKMTAAQVEEFLVKKIPNQKSESAPSVKLKNRGGATPLLPIRYATFKAEVFKTEVKKESDGSYSVSYSTICIGQGTAPVFDERGKTDYYFPDTPSLDCQDTVGGKPATVKIRAFLSYVNETVFSGEPPSDLKYFYPYISVFSPTMVQLSSAYILTRELNAHSMIGTAGNGPAQVCAPANDGSGDVVCTELQGEFFSANIEGLD